MEYKENCTSLHATHLRQPGGRNPSVSAARLIAMGLIISCHMLQYYDNELCRWLNVGVHVFFIISGYLYGSKEIDNPTFIKKGFIKILVPYYIFILASVLIYTLFAPNFLSFVSVFKAVLCAGTIKGLAHLWFIGYILFCYLLTPYLVWLRKIANDKSLLGTILFFSVLIVFIQLIGFAYDSYFRPDRVTCYIIGFFIPSILQKTNHNTKIVLLWITILLAIIVNCARIYFNYISVLFIPHALITILIIYGQFLLGLMLFSIMLTVLKLNYCRLLKWSDKYSYSVYLVHLLFVLSPFTLMKLTDFTVLNIIVVVAAIIMSATILQYISSKVLLTIKI